MANKDDCDCSKLDLDYNYSELSDIVQLDGPADNSDIEEEERVPLEENDFLGIINAEAIKALQEGGGSSDGNSISSSSDSEGADELANVEEEVRESECNIHFHESCFFFFPLKSLRKRQLSYRGSIFFLQACIFYKQHECDCMFLHFF